MTKFFAALEVTRAAVQITIFASSIGFMIYSMLTGNADDALFFAGIATGTYFTI